MKEVATLKVCRSFYGQDFLPRGLIRQSPAEEDGNDEGDEEVAEDDPEGAADAAGEITPGRFASPGASPLFIFPFEMTKERARASPRKGESM